MRFDGWDTMEGQHLVYAYVTVAVVQLAYFTYTAVQWLKITRAEGGAGKTAGRG